MERSHMTTASDPQDQFAMDFLVFMEKNFANIPFTELYIDRIPQKGDLTKQYTREECFDLFKKQHILPLPTGPRTLEEKLMAQALISSRRSEAFFKGLLRISELLPQIKEPLHQQLTDIIVETVNQIP